MSQLHTIELCTSICTSDISTLLRFVLWQNLKADCKKWFMMSRYFAPKQHPTKLFITMEKKSQCKTSGESCAELGYTSGKYSEDHFFFFFFACLSKYAVENLRSLHVPPICRYWNRRQNFGRAKKKVHEFPNHHQFYCPNCIWIKLYFPIVTVKGQRVIFKKK